MLIKRFLLVQVFFASICFSQQANSETAFRNYRNDADTVINHRALGSFFDKLKKIENSDTLLTVNILHIGDSHIQADFLTREIRNSLQSRFGNAGRGLVFPYRLTKSNESYDYRSHSVSSWKWENIRRRKRDFEPGIAGTSMLSTDDIFKFELKMNKRDSVDNTFRKVRLICRNDSNGLLAFVTDATSMNRKLVAFTGDTLYETKLEKSTDNIEIQSTTNILLDGIILTNEKKGILYHVVGINGAHYADFNQSQVFFSEMPLLQPDVVFVSLGTNEGVNSRVSSQSVTDEATKMVQNIRSQGLQAPILLITPFASYYRRKKPNPYLKVVQKGLIQAAEQTNSACLDMFEISGGTAAASEWRQLGLFANDRIHFTVKGYALQGKMIYNTLINCYTKYVGH